MGLQTSEIKVFRKKGLDNTRKICDNSVGDYEKEAHTKVSKVDFETSVLVSGRHFNFQELIEVVETVRMFPRLSRRELAQTICENLEWVTPAGKYKTASCIQLLSKLEAQGLLELPEKQVESSHDPSSPIEFSERTEEGEMLEGTLRDLGVVYLEPVMGRDAISHWNEYVHRYHALGYRRPFGSHQRYFIVSESGQQLGCLLFAAAAWALAPRDNWIGWSKPDRSVRLNLILNNSRYLIFPWVRVKNLASKALSLAAKRIRDDWHQRYGYRPVLLETFIDPEEYRGTCYQAANWTYLGRTQGRGRMDRYRKRPLSRKDIYVYPLTSNFRASLRGEGQ